MLLVMIACYYFLFAGGLIDFSMATTILMFPDWNYISREDGLLFINHLSDVPCVCQVFGALLSFGQFMSIYICLIRD